MSRLIFNNQVQRDRRTFLTVAQVKKEVKGVAQLLTVELERHMDSVIERMSSIGGSPPRSVNQLAKDFEVGEGVAAERQP